MEWKELVFRKIPFTVISIIFLYSFYRVATGGLISGLPIMDQNIINKHYHFRTFAILTGGWLATAYYNRDKKPYMSFYIATTVTVNGIALHETIHHLLTWGLIVERYGYIVFFKDMIFYTVFFCMNIPIIEKYGVHIEPRKLGGLFFIVLVLAFVKYPMLTFDFGNRIQTPTPTQDIPMSQIQAQNVLLTKLNRNTMTLLKTVCVLPFLYYSTRLRKIES